MRTVFVAAACAALVVTAMFSTTAFAVSAHTWQIQVGSVGITGGAFDGRSGNAFYPGKIAAHAGDTVAFNFTGPHTVTFNRPDGTPVLALFPPAGGTALNTPGQFVNSGFVPAGTFALTLGASLPAGSYKFICSLHLGMKGVIEVLPASANLPKTDADYAAEASREVARDLQSATEAAERAGKWVGDHPRTVLAGAGTRRVTNLRFYPSTITIHAGESIMFLKTKDPTEPHTATFGTEPANPFAPAGGPPFVFSGSNSVSTGAMLTKKQYAFYIGGAIGVPSAVRRDEIKFTTPGTYQYICAFHDEAGMRATVVVLP
ncbi:MAG TPA: plastocyanin/azurin family copper-binding protein [Candidatus Limnocylindria bacterium]|nr:plastocyanin/azurin family copper-binding protein [Candidatus Limnocylindria bacterium]